VQGAEGDVTGKGPRSWPGTEDEAGELFDSGPAVRAGIEEEGAFLGRATFDCRAIDNHRIREIKRGNVKPATPDQLLGGLVQVCGVEALRETAQLASCRSPANRDVLSGTKDLWEIRRKKVLFKLAHSPEFVRKAELKSKI
jgi:hypothetical protein